MKKSLYTFILSASELLASGLSVRETFYALSKIEEGDRTVKSTGKEICSSLEDGSSLSDSFAKCRSLRFPAFYCGLISAMEESGSVSEAFSFLREDAETSVKHGESVMAALVYPLFVILLAFASSLALCRFSSLFVMHESVNPLSGIIKGAVFLFVASALTLSFVFYCLSRNECLEACRVIHFLLLHGVPLARALKNAILLCRDGSPVQKILAQSLLDLQSGEELSKALKPLHTCASMYMQFSQRTGNIASAFLHLSNLLKSEQKKKETVCLSLLQPLLIVTVAVYIIILLKEIVIPVLFSTLVI